MYNNPYFNPYFNQKTYQPIENTMQQQTPQINVQNRLYGKQVESIEIAKNQEVSFDGSISYFPTFDNSAIITKQLMQDGTTKTLIYKPIKEDTKEVKYATIDDVKKIINDLDIEDLKDEIIGLKKKLKNKKED